MEYTWRHGDYRIGQRRIFKVNPSRPFTLERTKDCLNPYWLIIYDDGDFDVVFQGRMDNLTEIISG